MTDRRLSDIHKILVVRNDGIGDMLNSTPAIALLAQNYPDAEMTVLARPLNAPVLLGNPSVHRVLVFDRGRETSTVAPAVEILPRLAASAV